jgi:hypothetical protein
MYGGWLAINLIGTYCYLEELTTAINLKKRMKLMEKISVARALGSLKIIDKRITNAINSVLPVTCETGGRLPSGMGTKDDFIKDAKADYQSINDLIKLRAATKAAIVRSNAVTIVKIADEEMTIAAAIERKSTIDQEKLLKNRLASLFATLVQHVDTSNVKVMERLDQLLQVTYSKDSTKVKAEEYEATSKPFLASNQVSLVDPLDSKETIKKLGDRIDLFESEVDMALTESNARTEIEVE